MANYRFPKDFIWGVAGSAFQMEGGMYEGGKCLNVKEAAFLDPVGRESFEDKRSPEVTCDFYHKYPEDLELFKTLGLRSFRFSIAWSRIFPDPEAPACQAGIDYYDRMIDKMLELDIIPFFDLWHSDLPVWAEKDGRFLSDRFIGRYADYAETCFRAFGDRVGYWSTCNEPMLNVYRPYARGLGDIDSAIRASRNMLLAHFEAVKRLRDICPGAQVGSVHNTSMTYCYSFEPMDITAAERHYASQFLFLDPMILGEFPKEIMAWPGVRGHIPDEFAAQLKEAFVPMDFYGCNYYTPVFVCADEKTTYGTRLFRIEMPKDAYPFYTYSAGLTDLLMDLNDRYSGMPVLVTENGYTDRRKDVWDMDVRPFLNDFARQDYIREHLRACGRALKAGVNLKGYYYWSAMDCWESTKGYGYPMGLVAVNFDTLERTPKDSFYYYQKVIQNNMVD